MTTSRPGLVIAAIFAALVLVAATPWESPDRDVMLFVSPAQLVWADSEIEAHLIQRMTRHSNVRVAPVHAIDRPQPIFPPNYFDVEAVTAWGREVGARYVVMVLVENERLDRRKTLHVPLVFHRYATYGIIEGDLRIVDVSRGRLELAEPFRIQKKGPQIFQATMDDDIHDPDLHISAPDKITFFRHLEEELARELVKRIGAVIRMR